MQQKFLSNLILVVVLNLLVKPFYILGIDAEVQNRVGEEIYGNYFSLLNFSFLLNILLDLGLTNYNTRNIAQHPRLIAKHFYKILSLRLTLFIVYAGFTLVSAYFIGYSGSEFYLLGILMVNQFLVAVVQFCRSNFAGLHLFKTDSFISILDRSLLIIFCSVLLWTNVFEGDLQIEWFVYAQTAAYGLSALISLSLLIGRVGKVKLSVQRVFSIAVLKQSFPYALLILLMMLYTRIDAVMLERLLPNGDAQAGIYAQGYRLLDAVAMFALLFAGLLLPIFSRLIQLKKSVSQMLELAYRLLFGISVIVAVSCFFYQNQLIGLRYPTANEVSAHTFGYLILSFIPISLGYVFGTLLTANGSLKQLNIMAISGLALNVILNLVLIPKFKAEGAALATLITQSLTVFAQIVLAYALFKLPFNGRLYVKFAALGIWMYACQFSLFYYSDCSAFQALGILFFSSVLIAFFLGIFRMSDFKAVLKSQSVGDDEEGNAHS